MADQSNIVRRLVFRLVRKHIAGTTTGSVLRGVKQLNDRKLHATVTFLSENATNANKIRYNINTYVQFIRQISRLNLNADISLRLSQIGYKADREGCERGLDQIVGIAGKSDVKVWIESEDWIPTRDVLELISRRHNAAETLGIEIPIVGHRIERSAFSGIKNIRLTSYTSGGSGGSGKDIMRYYLSGIKVLGRRGGITVLEPDAKVIQKLVDRQKSYKRDIVFEVPLGYSNKRMNRLSKMKFNMSVYVPYGNDWIPYAIAKLTEGHIRDIARAVLDGEHKRGSNVQ